MNLTIHNIEHYKMSQFKELISLSSNDGEWIFTENTIEYINKGNAEKIYKYDENGNLLNYTNLINETIEVWRYNDKNQMTYHSSPNGETSIWEYDELGNLTYRKHANGYEEWWMYENGKKVHYSNSKFHYKDWKYNEYGQITEFSDSFGWKTENNYDNDIIISSYTFKNNNLEVVTIYTEGIKCFQHTYHSGETNWYDKRGSLIHSEIINIKDKISTLPETIVDDNRRLKCLYINGLLISLRDSAFSRAYIEWSYDLKGYRVKKSRIDINKIVKSKCYDSDTGKLIYQEIIEKCICKRYDMNNNLISYSFIGK